MEISKITFKGTSEEFPSVAHLFATLGSEADPAAPRLRHVRDHLPFIPREREPQQLNKPNLLQHLHEGG